MKLSKEMKIYYAISLPIMVATMVYLINRLIYFYCTDKLGLLIFYSLIVLYGLFVMGFVIINGLLRSKNER